MTVTQTNTQHHPAAASGCGEGAGKAVRLSREQLLAALISSGKDFSSWWNKSGEFLAQHEISVQELMEAAFMAGTVRAGAASGLMSAPPVPLEGPFTGETHFDIEPEVFSHCENGGRYEVIGTAIGEGAFQNAEMLVYRCMETGFFHFQSPIDFEHSMVLTDCPHAFAEPEEGSP